MCSITRNVEQVYAKDKKLKREDVRILQEWLKKQPHLPELQEIQIIFWLHSCFYSVEAAKATIDIYFTRRTQNLHIFERLNENELKETAATTLIDVLPETTPEGYYILFGKVLEQKADNFNLAKVIRMMDMICSICIYELGPAEGAVVVFDAKGFTMGHLAKFNLFIMKISLDHLQEGAPIRIKGIHIINAFSIVDKVLAMIKPFLKGELFNLIHVHSTMDTFYKFVPKECLPEEYNGKLPSYKTLQDQTVKHMLDNYDYFKFHDGQVIDENKRLEKSNVYGIEGTFKKLELD